MISLDDLRLWLHERSVWGLIVLVLFLLCAVADAAHGRLVSTLVDLGLLVGIEHLSICRRKATS